MPFVAVGSASALCRVSVAPSFAMASSIVPNVLIWTLTPYFFSNALTTSGLMYCCQL